MDESKTPSWLVETQNKSWEPEILISGITLTFIFIISNHIYNFYGMLVQDYGVWPAMTRMLYTISVISIAGLKIVLIFHLILRGIWTGLVGISYVFPDGVKKENLPKFESQIDHEKPVKFVIKIEKVCSLLFSFIFSSILMTIGFFVFCIPIVFLFVIGLDMADIRMIALYFIIPAVAAFTLYLVVWQARHKDSKIKEKLDSGPINVVMLIYVTNIGKLKTSMMFALYFVLAFLLSISELSKFRFENDKSAKNPNVSGIVSIKNDHYDSLRDQKLRIPKAVINQFRIEDNSLKLFLSYYQEDAYTITTFENNPEISKEFEIVSDSAKVSIPDIYAISIDGINISGLKWYKTSRNSTNQMGFMTSVPLDNFAIGYHEIAIDKVYWSVKGEEMSLIEDWSIIPFEKINQP